MIKTAVIVKIVISLGSCWSQLIFILDHFWSISIFYTSHCSCLEMLFVFVCWPTWPGQCNAPAGQQMKWKWHAVCLHRKPWSFPPGLWITTTLPSMTPLARQPTMRMSTREQRSNWCGMRCKGSRELSWCLLARNVVCWSLLEGWGSRHGFQM